jgi:hypothetical protein
MDYIRNLDCVKCLVIIFRVILLWNSEGLWKRADRRKNGPFLLTNRAFLYTAVRCAFPRGSPLALSVLEEFHLAQALLGLGFRLVGSAEILLAVL